MRKHVKKLVAAAAALVLTLAMGLTILADSAPAGTESYDVPATGVSSEEISPEEAVADEDEATTEEEIPSEEEEPPAEEPEAVEEEPALTEEQPEAEAPAVSEEPTPEGPAPEAQSAYGTEVDESSIIVTTYAELKKALGEDNGYTTVYLGADITTDASGISVDWNKPFITIDGQPPGTDTRHTLTQYVSGNSSYTIRVDNENAKTTTITLRNMIVNGGNHFGIVAVGAYVQAATLIHENIDYTGPQPAFNHDGTTRFIDSSYTLQTTGGVAAGELAETLHAEMGGTVTVNAPATTNSILWLQGSASTLTILEGADVTINTANYFIYTSGYTPTVTLQAGSGLSVTDKNGFTNGDQRISTFSIAKDANLYINQNSAQSYAALRVSKLFQMMPGSSATILRTGTDGIPLRLTNAGARVLLDQPQRVFLYSTAGVPLRFTGSGELSIVTSALNVWKKTDWPGADTLDTLPTHVWNKTGTELLTLTGVYNEAANQSLTSNLTPDDPVVTALDKANFNLEGSQLIALGSMTLGIDTPLSTSSALTGSTQPGAQVAADYIQADGQGGKAGGTASGDGRYNLPVSGGLAVGSSVTMLAGADRLVMRQQETVVDAGLHRLAFLAVPDSLHFGSVPVPGSQTLVQHGESEFTIKVADSRLSATPWRLNASLSRPLMAAVEGGQSILPNAIVFTDANGNSQPLNEVPMTVYRQSGGAAGDYDIAWGGGEGVQLSLAPGQVYSGVDYTATIHWSLVDAP